METITGFLTDDHRLADELFAGARQHAGRCEWAECSRALAKFRAALESHMQLEEEVLFPAFERVTNMDGGPTAVMRSEHREMLQQLDALASATTAGNGDGFDGLAQSFLHILDAHSMKEEKILYPMCDRLVSALNADELKRTLQRIRRGG